MQDPQMRERQLSLASLLKEREMVRERDRELTAQIKVARFPVGGMVPYARWLTVKKDNAKLRGLFALLASCSGETQQNIARMLGVKQPTVSTYIEREKKRLLTTYNWEQQEQKINDQHSPENLHHQSYSTSALERPSKSQIGQVQDSPAVSQESRGRAIFCRRLPSDP